MSAATQRYTAVAIVLHWAIAAAILGMIPLGWWMDDALNVSSTQAQAIAAYQLHKSVGLTILMLSLARLAWRLMHAPPPLPANMPKWESTIATLTHWAFYFIIIAMPLTGWLYVSTGWSVDDNRPLNVPTLYFGLFQVPHLFGLAELADGARSSVAAIIGFSHSKMAWGAIGLTALHVGAALKHHFRDKDDVLTRMVPGLKSLSGEAPSPAPAGRAPILIGGLVAILLAGAGALWLFQHPQTTARAAPASASAQAQPEAQPQAATNVPAPAGAPSRTADGPASERTAAAPTPAAGSAPPPAWRVDQAGSSIRFTGTHAGVAFEGRFSRWRAEIRFDPNNLTDSRATVTIETGSAADGVPLHDQSMPEDEWFDVADHPTATFRTTAIRARGEGRYEADGALNLKGRNIDIELPFTLHINGDNAVMDGNVSIDRRAANLGQASDPGAEYVSQAIGVRVHVEATRAP